MLRDNRVYTMAADALDPAVTRSSATIIFDMRIIWDLVFYQQKIRLDVSVKCGDMIDNANTSYVSWNKNSTTVVMCVVAIGILMEFSLIIGVNSGECKRFISVFCDTR